MTALAAFHCCSSFGLVLLAGIRAFLTLRYAISCGDGSRSSALYCLSDTGLGLYPSAEVAGVSGLQSPPCTLPGPLAPSSGIGNTEKTSTTSLGA